MVKRTSWILALLLATGTATAQNCGEEFPTATRNLHLQDNGDGTVTDLETRLIWKRCAEGLSGTDCTTGELAFFTYPQALRWAAKAQFADSTLWRVPSREELATLVKPGCRNPALNTRYFPNTPANWFWSSTAGAGYPYYAWSIHFGDGQAGLDPQGVGNLRLVRYAP